MDTTMLLAASAAVNRFIELIKPTVRGLEISERAQDAALVALALASGIIVASVGDLNLLGDTFSLPLWLERVITGALIGAGADVLNAVIDLLYGWRDRSRP